MEILGSGPTPWPSHEKRKKVVLYGSQLQFIAVRMRIAGARARACVCAQCTDCVVITC